jgi:hypothetical protein
MPESLDRVVAFHEAGHAVAAIRAGLVFDYVSAIPNEEFARDGELTWPEMHGAIEIVMPPETLAVVLLAGACAEAKLRGLRFDRVFSGEGALDDRAGVAGLGLSDAQFIAASRETQTLIEHDWLAIEVVAEELEAGYDLNFDEVAEIVAAQDAGELGAPAGD